MKKIFYLVLAVIIASCSEDVNQEDQIDSVKNGESKNIEDLSKTQEAISNLQNSFIVKPNEGATLITEKGSRIIIPKNAFEDESGNKIEQEVQVLFEEYHTVGEIIASGLPMTYTKPDGETIDFESAGMFVISANVNGQNVEVANGKEISVDLVSDNPEKFDFFQLQDNDKNWILKDTDCLPIENKYKKERQKEIEVLQASQPEKPKRIKSYTKGDKVFDIKTTKQFEIITELNGVVWLYTGEDESKNPALNLEEFNATYKFLNMITVEGEYFEYDIVFSTPDKSSDTVRACPIVDGALQKRSDSEYKDKLEAFEQHIENINKLREQNKRESKLLRSMNISEFGVYNYDRMWKEPNTIPFLAEFTLDGAPIESDFVSVYLMPQKLNVTIKYVKSTFKNFRINPMENNNLIAIDENNQIYALSDVDLKKLNLMSNINKECVINLKPKGTKANSSEDIDDVLATL